MIKVEDFAVMIRVEDSDEVNRDYMTAVRGICLYYMREEHLPDEEAKRKVRELTEEALKLKVADSDHMQATDWVERILHDIFCGGPSCT